MIAGSNRARTFGTLSIEWHLPLAIHALPGRDLVAEASEVSQKMANGEPFRFSRNRRTAPCYRVRTARRFFQNSAERVFESGAERLQRSFRPLRKSFRSRRNI